MESEQNNSVATEDAQERPSETERDHAGFAADGSGDRERLLLKERDDLQELLQRRQAEFENYRRRVERERGDFAEYATAETIKALLPVLDDFERALKVESTDKEFGRGMEMIYKRLSDTLRKLGLEPLVNDVPVFNPHLHQAVEVVDTDEHPDQTILDEYQKGYFFKGKLVREAMVKVARNS